MDTAAPVETTQERPAEIQNKTLEDPYAQAQSEQAAVLALAESIVIPVIPDDSPPDKSSARTRSQHNSEE